MIRLVSIGQSGTPTEPLPELGDLAREACRNTRLHYAREGFHPPWCGYFAVRDDQVVGVCGFRGPPDHQEKVIIAYRVFPGHEGRGLGSAIVEALVGIARDHNPVMTVVASTEPADSGSTRILERLGFRHAGEANDPYIGRAWSWWLEPGDPAVDPAPFAPESPSH